MIEVLSAHKALGEFSLRGVDLRVDAGEYMVVLGPTGAGKTVLLECIAGIHSLDRGEVWLHGRNVTRVAPEHRNVAYVPQDYVLFSHMSLRDNIEFPLRLRRADRDAIDRTVRNLTETLRIDHLLARRPRTLSGGEQQRGALARALASSPDLLLLDEPLSALDEGTRADLSNWLSRVTDELGTSVIHVCHNFDEALDLADRIAVMHHGRVLQVGAPTEVLRRPATEFLARFMGSANLYAVTSTERDANVVVLEGGVRLRTSEVPAETDLLATIRPESIAIAPLGASPGQCADGPNRLEVTIAEVQDRGRQVRIRVNGPLSLVVSVTPQSLAALSVSIGDRVVASIDPHDVHLLARGDDRGA